MTINHSEPIGLKGDAEAMAGVNDDIKRELAFYNNVRENVM